LYDFDEKNETCYRTTNLIEDNAGFEDCTKDANGVWTCPGWATPTDICVDGTSFVCEYCNPNQNHPDNVYYLFKDPVWPVDPYLGELALSFFTRKYIAGLAPYAMCYTRDKVELQEEIVADILKGKLTKLKATMQIRTHVAEYSFVLSLYENGLVKKSVESPFSGSYGQWSLKEVEMNLSGLLSAGKSYQVRLMIVHKTLADENTNQLFSGHSDEADLFLSVN
jgi:hypothetical protein